MKYEFLHTLLLKDNRMVIVLDGKDDKYLVCELDNEENMFGITEDDVFMEVL
ncbi:hypothetical protein [Coprococcus sp. AF38-1]|uniref:hypothetical protein n=1 Tax=Coprococcus sp. AF38-1 TaxID=2302943 RepID=UPI001403FBF6|nr:hypothetical protein [Coprococcus sp. AF38-1]